MSTSTEMVTSIGNSWIICRSKSHAGRIYYFNTLTGEAAWNLSESEIEKAKKRTSILESQTGFQIDNCPEPIESPQDQLNPIPNTKTTLSTNNQQMSSQNIIPSKVYNKQIINNQFPKSSYPYPGQFPTMSALNPIQLNIPITPTINPGLWNVTPHPIFVTPSAINQQTVLNNTFKDYEYVPVTNTSIPLSSRFKSQGESYAQSILSQRKSQVNTGNTFRGRKNNYRNRFYKSRSNMDLRLLISSKKKNPNIGNCEVNEIEDFQQGHCNEKSINSQSTDKRNTFNLSPCDDDDDDDVEENLKMQNSNDSLDTTPLKKLLRVENNFEAWYIVFDSNVLLNNINFLKMLLNSDNKCRLMVPQIVMDKIQMATNSRLRTQAHRAAYFILQQVDANVAVIDKGNEEENGDDKDIILNCCSKLTDQGYQVVLLTDDIELHNFEGRTSFLVFTVRELKKMLSKTVAQGLITNSLEDDTIDETRSIKITIPNHVNKISFDRVEENKQKCAIVYPAEAYFEKKTEDSAFEPIVLEDFVTNEIQKNTGDVGVQANSTDLHIVNETNNKILDTSFLNKLCKTKDVSVNCRLLNENKSNLSNIETKNTKWHKNKEKPFTTMDHSNIYKQIKLGNIIEENRPSNYENLAGNVSHVSNDSFQHCNFEDNVETSSFVQTNLSENLEIEEKSSSTTLKKSNDHNAESDQTATRKKNDDVKEKHLPETSDNEDKNVMFEVTSSAMEDCLKRKSDEWISRFVQIIEEASTQVLQQDPPFILDTMLPPWTIYEATECIKRKFSNDNDIVDAANKLLNVLFDIGGLRGKLKIDISPNKYMQMYSYGVYLIDALQGLLTNNEDLQIAAESLSKLLCDVQDSHLHPNNQDSFTDAPLEDVANVTEEKTSNEKEVTKTVYYDKVGSANHSESKNITLISITPIKKSRPGSIIGSPGSYNLRSHKKKLLQFQENKEQSEKVTFIRNIDLESSFFTSLRLKKKLNAKKNIEPEVNKSFSDKNIENQNDSEVINTESISENVNITNENIDIIKPQNSNLSNEIKIIRNFTRCLEYEKKLEKKIEEQKLIFDDWTNKNDIYRTDCGENEEMDYTSLENPYYYDNYELFDTEEMVEVNPLRGIEIEESVNSVIEKTNFKDIIKILEHNIREAFSSVHGFCDKCYTTLSSGGSRFEKKEMHHLAEDTHSYLNNLCDALNSTLTRETSESPYKIQELLNIEELQEIIIEDGDVEGYRNFIRKCLEQGDILKDSVQLVIDASRE